MTDIQAELSGDTRTSRGIISKRGVIAGVATLGLGVGLTLGLIGHDSWERKNDRIADLEADELEDDLLLNATLALGSAGVRFSDVMFVGNDENEDRTLVVEIPGTSANCQSISFNFDSTAEGWTLSLQQPDAAGNIYDQAEAHDAAQVQMLVEDLCS